MVIGQEKAVKFAPMDEPSINIPVTYKGVEKEFGATVQRRGYFYVFQVDVDGTNVTYERDEEGNYRAVVSADEKGRVPHRDLLQAIGEIIEEIVREVIIHWIKHTMKKINWGIIGCGDVTEIKSGPAFKRGGDAGLVGYRRRHEKKAKD